LKQFLLDTNICIFFLRGKYDIDRTIEIVGIENCFVSEITIAELKFGAENSNNPVENNKTVNEFQEKFDVLPIFSSLDLYAKEKARLRKQGNTLDDFDLLIGATAITNGLTLVTNNTSDFKRLQGIATEDWTQETGTR